MKKFALALAATAALAVPAAAEQTVQTPVVSTQGAVLGLGGGLGSAAIVGAVVITVGVAASGDT
ncbi:hypothetical protein MHM39_06930 [Phaeobacter sp. CNT1-3]|jgi:opacity protein-like surface antigen|nr:hypothetical protein [Phaeobacter sp. CNT1-3]